MRRKSNRWQKLNFDQRVHVDRGPGLGGNKVKFPQTMEKMPAEFRLEFGPNLQ